MLLYAFSLFMFHDFVLIRSLRQEAWSETLWKMVLLLLVLRYKFYLKKPSPYLSSERNYVVAFSFILKLNTIRCSGVLVNLI